MKCWLAASALLLCVTATGGASAQGIQLRKQTKEIPLPAPAKPKPAVKPEATPTAPTTPDALTATQLFNMASPSVVVVRATDKDGNILATGSGVVVARGEGNFFTVATNCHVVDTAGSDGEPVIKTDSGFGLGEITRRDAARDVCLVLTYLRKTDAAGNFIRSDGRFVYPPAPPVAKIAPLRTLEVGERVYAIGAPQGLELSLSEGLVSGLRKDGGTTLIQTTAAISKGSSGGGLFDAQGRLVGITTMFLKEGQALNFAVPAELIASVPDVKGVSDSTVAPDAQAAADAAAAAADTAAPTPPRDRWWTFYEDETREIAFDTKTVQREGTNVIAWTRTRLAKPKTLAGGKTWIELIARNTFYCGSRRTSFDQETARNAAGDVVHSRQLKSYEIETEGVMPDSIGESEYEAACNEL